MAFKFKPRSSQKSHQSRFISRKPIIGALIVGGAMLLTLVSRGHAQSPETGDPVMGYHIEMTVGAITVYFDAMSGLESESSVIEQKVMVPGTRETAFRKIPGAHKWGDIVLKRTISRNKDLSNWRNMVETGKVDHARLNATFIAYVSSLMRL